jgi:hypothetical protein
MRIAYEVPHNGENLTEQQQTENSHALGLAVKDIPGIQDILTGMRIGNAIKRSNALPPSNSLHWNAQRIMQLEANGPDKGTLSEPVTVPVIGTSD